MKSQDSSSDTPPVEGKRTQEDVEAKDASWVDNAEDYRSLLSYEEEKKLLRRVDWRLVPLSAFIFLVKSLDVNNASNARIMNRGTDRHILKQLNMTGDDYNFVSTVFFIPFVVFEIPSLLIMKRMLPSRFQARIMFTWGIVLACHAAVTSAGGLYAARLFLGLAEAGMFPGIILQLSYWYRADELTIRLLWFYSFEFFSGVISAVLAFAFDHASGRCGLSGWQWLFLFEGICTIAFSAVVWFGLPDFPEQAKWLSDKEKAFLQARLPKNSPRSSESNFKASEIMVALKDIRMWLFTLVFATKTIGSSGLTFYLPKIVADLGLATIAKSQLLTIPASVIPLLLIAMSSYLTGYRNVPSPVIPLAYTVVMLACYAAIMEYPNLGGVYTATILASSVSHAWFACMWPWRLQTTSRATGSAFSIGFVNSLGQIGTVVGPQIFRSRFAPHYSESFGIAMCFTGCCIILTCVTWWMTRTTEKQTRQVHQIRIAAAKRGERLDLDADVDADADVARRLG